MVIKQRITTLQSDIQELKQKLIAGKNEESHGFQKFANAQFYENLTKEEYSGNYRNSLAQLKASRDSLNPVMNLETLKNRLWVTEHYRLLHGVEYAYWPHYAMRNVGGHLWKYKFNYALKGFFAYQTYREIKNYTHLNSVTFMKTDKQAELLLNILWCGFLTTSVALLF